MENNFFYILKLKTKKILNHFIFYSVALHKLLILDKNLFLHGNKMKNNRETMRLNKVLIKEKGKNTNLHPPAKTTARQPREAAVHPGRRWVPCLSSAQRSRNFRKSSYIVFY